MIPNSASTTGLAEPEPLTGSWHRSLAEAILTPAELIVAMRLDEQLIPGGEAAAQQFPVMVPQSYLRRMQPGDAQDPLLLQVLPVGAEVLDITGFTADPVDDSQYRIAPGVLRKYGSRALLITTGSCAVHCRYCFRRHYPYEVEPKRLSDWDAAITTLQGHPDIDEVILSGGDPLMLTDQRLKQLVEMLESVTHVARLRIHSRLPIVLPDRVTPELIDLLRNSRLTPIVVVHANHAAEIVGDCRDSLRTLVRSGITTLNQAVLLRGVNDSVAAQVDLCRELSNVGVLPYYLNLLDRVAGAAHFEVDEAVGIDIIQQIRCQLPGYAVPRLVRDIPGQLHKAIIA